MVSLCKAFSKCKASKRKHVCVGIFFFSAALLCFFAIGPVYMGTLSTPVSQFADCAECGSEYAMYVVNEVNGTAVMDKIIEAHHENNKFHRGHHHHHHHHHGHDDDVCITEEDVKSINFHDVHLKPISRDCIDTCAPIAQKAALAAACTAATAICAIALLVCSLGAFLCALCCKGRDSSQYEKIDSMSAPGYNPAREGPTGTAFNSDPLKAPLMPGKQ